MKKLFVRGVFLCAALACGPAITANLAVTAAADHTAAVVEHGNDPVGVERVPSMAPAIDHTFGKSSTPCPPFCVNPLHVAETVGTVAELEVIEFIENTLHSGTGVVIDARTSDRYSEGTIPGSINIPFTVFEKAADDPYLVAVLEQLGASHRDRVNFLVRTLEKFGFLGGSNKTDAWDFTDAKELLIWCNGPWCSQSPRAIRALVNLGYPAEKLHYYRGGMQVWQSLGLSTVVPTDTSAYASK